MVQTTVETVGLLLSHLALIPSIYYTILLRALPEFTILIVLFFESTFYHLCQGGWFCVIEFDVHQRADHFFVYTTLIWILLFFLGLKLQIRISITFVIQGLIFPFLLFYIHSTWLGIALFVMFFVLFLFVAGVWIKTFPRMYWINLIILVVLLGGGFSFFVIAGEPGEENYAWTHTIWHICILLSIYFILDLKFGKSWLAQKFAAALRHSSASEKKKKAKKNDSSSSSSSSTKPTQKLKIPTFGFFNTNSLLESDEEQEKEHYTFVSIQYESSDDDDEESEEQLEDSSDDENQKIEKKNKKKYKTKLKNPTMNTEKPTKKKKEITSSKDQTWTNIITIEDINEYSKTETQKKIDRFTKKK